MATQALAQSPFGQRAAAVVGLSVAIGNVGICPPGGCSAGGVNAVAICGSVMTAEHAITVVIRTVMSTVTHGEYLSFMLVCTRLPLI